MQPRFAFLSRFLVKFLEVGGAGLASAMCAYALGQMGAAPAPPTSIAQVSSVSQAPAASQPSAAGQPASAREAAPASAVASAVNEPVVAVPREDRVEPVRADPAHTDAEATKKPDSVIVARTPAPAAKLVKQPVQSHRPQTQKPEQPAVVEVRPVEAKSVEAKSVEAKSLEAKPLESRPPEASKPRVVERQLMMPPPSAAADVATKPTGQSIPGPSVAAPSAATQGVDAGRDAPGAKREEDKPLFARLRLVPSWFSSGTDKANERPDDRTNARPAANDVPRPPMPVGEWPRGLM
jgi:hypothetical protein